MAVVIYFRAKTRSFIAVARRLMRCLPSHVQLLAPSWLAGLCCWMAVGPTNDDKNNDKDFEKGGQHKNRAS